MLEREKCVMRNEIQQRDITLDCIRALAIFCVVINHVVEEVYPLGLDFMQDAPIRIRVFCIGLFTFGRTGVPLFFMLSGYLLLGRKYDANEIIKFYKHNFLSLVVVWEIWIFIYSIFLACFNQVPFNAQEYLRKAFFLEHAGLPHSWYMPVIIGIYFVLPYVAIALQNINKKQLTFFILIAYIYIFLVPCINLFQSALQVTAENRFNNQLDLSFGGEKYGFYLILGYYLFRFKGLVECVQNNIKKYILIFIICIITFVSAVWCQLKLYSLNYEYSLWYDFYLMPILGGCVFLLCTRLKMIKVEGIITELSKCAFGIYLIHELILMICLRKIENILDQSTLVIVLSIVIYFVSFLIIEILSLIPKLNNIFLKK